MQHKIDTKGKTVMLETVHGSHLYGLNHAGSDVDTYRVVTDSHKARYNRQRRSKTTHKITGDDDVTVVSLSSFLNQCWEGVPQALEAMFSQDATSAMVDYQKKYRLNTPRFAVTHGRTLKNFARLGVEDETAREMLAPTESEMFNKHVRESAKLKKPQRVELNGMLKYRRHAMRLLLQLEQGLENGYFNPRLSDAQRAYVVETGDLSDVEFATRMMERHAFV